MTRWRGRWPTWALSTSRSGWRRPACGCWNSLRKTSFHITKFSAPRPWRGTASGRCITGLTVSLPRPRRKSTRHSIRLTGLIAYTPDDLRKTFMLTSPSQGARCLTSWIKEPYPGQWQSGRVTLSIKPSILGPVTFITLVDSTFIVEKGTRLTVTFQVGEGFLSGLWRRWRHFVGGGAGLLVSLWKREPSSFFCGG